MVLIVFLLAYLIRRYLDTLDTFSGDKLWQHWFHRATRAEAGKEAHIRGGLALIVLPAFLCGVGVYLLDEMSWRVLGYFLECLILVLLMGMPGWRQSLLDYAGAWNRGDMQAAWRHIQNKLPIDERGAALSPESMHLSLLRVMVLTVFQRFFLIVFWYVAGGIGFAILARGLVALSAQWPQTAARPRFVRLLALMEWIPARLLSFTFGVAGDLTGWLHDMRLTSQKIKSSTEDILMISANGSLTGYVLDPEKFSRSYPDKWTDFGGRSVNAVRDLLNRSMLVWICVLALLVISGLV